MRERRIDVLQVLPHPGGGGETYVDLLSHMEGARSQRLHLAASRERRGAIRSLIRSVPAANLRSAQFDILHVNGEIPALLCLLALACRPSVVTLHGLSFVRRSSGAAGQAAATNLRLLVRAASRTICVSEAEHAEVVELVGTRLAHRLALVPYGVDIPEPPRKEDRAAARSELDLGDEIVVVWVGALDYPKDPVTPSRVVAALAEEGLPIRLCIVGDGSLRSEVEAVARNSAGAVRVLGHRSDVRRLLLAADVFALTSRHEGLPFALLEAMALQLPAVVSDYPGASDAVGDAGIVVSGERELRNALERLASNANERTERGERARSRLAARFSLDTMLESTRRVYDGIR